MPPKSQDFPIPKSDTQICKYCAVLFRGVETEPIANCPPPEESNFTVVLPEAPRNDSFLRLSVHVYQTCPTVPPGRGAMVERVSNALPHTRAHHTGGRARLDRAPASASSPRRRTRALAWERSRPLLRWRSRAASPPPRRVYTWIRILICHSLCTFCVVHKSYS